MISPAVHSFISIDLLPMLTGTLAAVTCGLLGNFLVLRRLSLMGDAISHSVLPGLVIAFLLTGSRSPWPMFLGAALAGVATVVLVEVVKKLGRVEPGAAMGVVFSVLFALGVLLIEQAAARHVDLDADCVLHGQLETLFWFPPATWGELLAWPTLGELPRQVVTLGGMLLVAVIFVAVLFKELRLAAFDPGLSTTLGFHAGVLHYLLMLLVAAATVASFEAVGSILVIAMLVCPAATARLLTDRMGTQIAWSVVLATVSGVGGYLAATVLPASLGMDSVNAAGMMAVVAGGLLGAAVIASPRYGVIAKALRQRGLSRQIALEDLLAALYRLHEQHQPAPTAEALRAVLTHVDVQRLLAHAHQQNLIALHGDTATLTEQGHARALELVRRHRLWETYLVEESGVRPDHVHDAAERFEHTPVLPPAGATRDPHGRSIPGA